MAAKKTASKPRSAAKAPAKRGPGRPRKDSSAPRQRVPRAHAGPTIADFPKLDTPRPILGRGLSTLLEESWVIRGTHIVGEPVPPPDTAAVPPRPIDDALAQLSLAIAGMATLTDDESEALAAVLEPELPGNPMPERDEPASQLAAHITRYARRIEDCNAYRRARLARIDLPRG